MKCLLVFALTADRIYPAQLGISLDDAKRMYLHDMLSDEAGEIRCIAKHFSKIYRNVSDFVSSLSL